MRLLFISWLMLGWLLVGCSTSRGSKSSSLSNSSSSSTSTSGSDADFEKTVKAHAAFAAGIARQLNEDSDGMLHYFEQSVVNDPSNEALAIEVARRRFARNQPDAARAVLDRVAAQPGASGEVYSLLGLAYVELGRTNEALTAYRKAVSLEPQAVPALRGVAQILAQRKDLPSAMKALDAAPRGTNVSVGFLVDLGELYIQVGSADGVVRDSAQKKAVELYQQALKRHPDDPVVLQRIADRFTSFGMAKEAEPILKDLRERYSQSPLPAARLAEMYLREGRLKEASEQLDTVRRLDPINPLPYFYLGLVAMDEKKLEVARNNFQHAIALNPAFQLAYPELAAVFLDLGQTDDALNTLAKARHEFPPDFRIEFITALAHSRQKKYDDALAALSRAETVAKTNNPSLLDHRFYFQVGALAEEKGDHAKAEENLKKSLSLKPDYDEALNHLGYMWAEAGVNLKEAREMIEKAVKADPENGAYLDSLGWVLYKLGKPLDALPWLEKANKSMKEPDATVLEHLGDVYAALQRWKEARDAWSQSLKLESNDKVKKKLDSAPAQP